MTVHRQHTCNNCTESAYVSHDSAPKKLTPKPKLSTHKITKCPMILSNLNWTAFDSKILRFVKARSHPGKNAKKGEKSIFVFPFFLGFWLLSHNSQQEKCSHRPNTHTTRKRVKRMTHPPLLPSNSNERQGIKAYDVSVEKLLIQVALAQVPKNSLTLPFHLCLSQVINSISLGVNS